VRLAQRAGFGRGSGAAGGVVVIDVDREYMFELAAVDDQDPVEELSA
jgi:hypothetical protein